MRGSNRDERGMALVATILILLGLIIIAAGMASNSITSSKLAGIQQRRTRALDLAEAGVSEAVARIGSAHVPADMNPRMVTQIFLTTPGNVPLLGPDSTGLATAQPAGNWLTYSSESRGPHVLTVRYKTDAARTVVYKYDPTRSPPIQTASGYPIYEILSTGRVGETTRRVMTEVVARPINLLVRGAVVSGVGVKLTGNAFACGYNHRHDTPTNTGAVGRSGVGGCNERPGVPQWEVASGDRVGVWSGSAIAKTGASSAEGVPAGDLANRAGFYAGPWEVLGMTEAEFWTWVGPRRATAPATLNGIVHLDDNSTPQDQSASYSLEGGSGFLYVDGDLTLKGNVAYRGLIYVEGDVKITGNAWVLGGVIVRGRSRTDLTGGATILYSQDAILLNIARHGGGMTNLAWRELK